MVVKILLKIALSKSRGFYSKINQIRKDNDIFFNFKKEKTILLWQEKGKNNITTIYIRRDNNIFFNYKNAKIIFPQFT